MRKRLRKKLQRAEFTEYVFNVTAEVDPRHDGASEEESFFRPIWWEFEQRLHELGLCSGGDTKSPWDIVVVRPGGSVTEKDRRMVMELLQTSPAVRRWEVGALLDPNSEQPG